VTLEPKTFQYFRTYQGRSWV